MPVTSVAGIRIFGREVQSFETRSQVLQCRRIGLLRIPKGTETMTREEMEEGTDEDIRSVLAIAQMHEQEISTLGQLIGSVSRDVATLGETTKATNERLNALINVVERQISHDRNGKK
jgi:DNA replication protein DnaD